MLRRIVLAIGAAVTLAAVAPAHARAGEIVRSCSFISCADAIRFEGFAGERNEIRSSQEYSGYVMIADRGAPIRLRHVDWPSENACEYPDARNRHRVRCPARGRPRLFLNLGNRNDRAVVDAPGPMTVFAGTGDDVVLLFSVGTAFGGDGNDTLRGWREEDFLYGGGGDDLLEGGEGADDLHGGPGNDTVTYDVWNPEYGDQRRRGVRVTIGDGHPNDGGVEDESGRRRDEVHRDVEIVRGTSHNDVLIDPLSGGKTLVGLGGDDVLIGNEGDDRLYGGGSSEFEGRTYFWGGANQLSGGVGNDVLTGGHGDDRIDGGAGNDVLYGDDLNVARNGSDLLVGGTGNDRLDAGDLSHDLTTGRASADTFVGGAGFDIVTYERRTAPVAVTVDGAPGDGASGEGDNVIADVEQVNGGSAADTLVGNAFTNTFRGGGGNDTLIGEGNSDVLRGDDGDDMLFALDGAVDVVDGGPASDCAESDDGMDNVVAVERPACLSPPPAPITITECADGRDNDGDGRIDHPADPGCDTALDTSESPDPATPPPPPPPTPVAPECSDGKDNDGDGLVDYPKDDGCKDATDPSELDDAPPPPPPPPAPECSDGKDNDGDGAVDFPDDKQCKSAGDDDESS
jgi:Ca2+-binding RTX toxin-like protein